MRDFSQAEKLYVDELRAFRTYLQSHTSIRVNYSIHGPPTEKHWAPPGPGTHYNGSGASGGTDPPYSRRNPL